MPSAASLPPSAARPAAQAPLVVVLACFATGIVVDHYLPLAVWLWMLLLASAALAWVWLWRSGNDPRGDGRARRGAGRRRGQLAPRSLELLRAG